jgi:hypothetical protein
MEPMKMIRELSEEFRAVLAGRASLIDILLPPVAFLLLNAWVGFGVAMGGALAASILLAVLRFRRGQSLVYALGGLLGVVIAILVARLSGRAEGFFLPGILGSVLTVAGCLISVLVRRPLVALTSHLARRWPLGWYWHAQVRPAYAEVTLAWTVFFALRLALQIGFYQRQAAAALATLNAFLGWPATIVLLAISYLYGQWRLGHLGGPSVDEYRDGAAPPWTGQRRGF